jgi:phage-related minor tail protein
MDDEDIAGTLGYAENLRQVLGDLEQRSARFGTALGGALKSAVAGGKGLDDVLRGLGNRMTDIALSAGLKPLENLLAGQIAGLTRAVSGSLSSFADGGVPGSVTAFARGGVPGRVSAFAAGGVVSAPSYFPIGGDLGLMGEAGSEAILPLKRGPDGALGVGTDGGSGGGGMQVVFNVTATDAASFRKSEGQITAMLARSVGRGRRGL